MKPSPEAVQALTQAKIGLMLKKNSVFIATVLFSLKQVWDPSIPTAATNGTVLKVNPDFFLKDLTAPQRIFLIAHEAWHVAFDHMGRGKGLQHQRYNAAADHVINLMLKKYGYDVPSFGLCDPQFAGMSTEQVYALLPEDTTCDMPDLMPPPESSPNAHKQRIDSILMKAYTQAKHSGEGVGGMPSDIAIYIDKLTNPKLPWFTIIRKFMTDMTQGDYTWRKPNRRFMPEFYLPTLHSEALGHIASAVDSSISVSDREFTAFISELSYMKKTYKPKLLTIVDFDTRIKSVHTLSEHQDLSSISFTGRGGTSLFPVFEHFAENEPNLLIVFSDLECMPITVKPKYPVIWVCVNNPSAQVNFGKLIHLTI